MNRTATSILFVLLSHLLSAQTNPPIIKKSLGAKRIYSPIHIDGILDESEWADAPVATDFVQSLPNPGKPSTQKTEVKVLYDDEALYIGAVMYDTSNSKIHVDLSQRDGLDANADWFGVDFSPYNDGLNGTGLIVTAAGVQVDFKMLNTTDDINWDAVWYSRVRVYPNKWVVEMKVPFSVLRFPKAEEQTWGLNFARSIIHNREKSYWNSVDPKVNGFLNQAGILTGIKNINPPLRLALYPYVSAYYENYHDKQLQLVKNSHGFSGGMDLKYGINDAFTLDMTLIPDFSQVQSDAKVLNLSPIETYFEERRQFFTEGTELFNKGGLFYSRRVGGLPLGYSQLDSQLRPNEIIVDNPDKTQLINATKISGRTKGNLGIGVFNAVSAETFATALDTTKELNASRQIMTSPLINYNVFVLDQGLKNNSYFTFINTNVMREGKYYDADVTGTEFNVNNKKQSFGISGNGAISQKYLAGFDSTRLGYSYGLALNKISGNWTAKIDGNWKDNHFDPNDLGYLSENNVWGGDVNTSYTIYDPFGPFLSMQFSLSSTYFALQTPNAFQDLTIDATWVAEFKNYLSYSVTAFFEPHESYDYYETRVPGRFVTLPGATYYNASISTDYTKKLALDLNVLYLTFNRPNWYRWLIIAGPRYRMNDHVFMVLNFEDHYWINDVGFVQTDGTDILFGVRDVATYVADLSGEFVLNNKMAISLNVRHYWSAVKYNRLAELGTDGSLQFNTPLALQYPPSHFDINYNAFNVDMVYSWRFAPGSELDVIWKNAIDDYLDGSMAPPGMVIAPNYKDDLTHTFNAPQTNNFSIKLIYYLDYQMVKKAFRKQKNESGTGN